VAEWLGRGLQSLVQRFESARRLLAALVLALVVAACGTQEQSESVAQQLVPQLSDLPAGFDHVPAESFPVSLETVLAEPWSAGVRAMITRERLSGYQAAFWSPQRQPIQCSAAVYRSAFGATEVSRARRERFVAELEGAPVRVQAIGAETRAYRYRLGDQLAVTLGWRFRHVLSSCTAAGRTVDVEALLVVARAQQTRIARILDEGRS
jgi:hypothetical protein